MPDDELEYHFHLTPSVMRSFNGSGFKPISSNKNVNTQGILSYVSEVIRTGDLSSTAIRVPSEGVLGCNNIKNVKDGKNSGICDPVDTMLNY